VRLEKPAAQLLLDLVGPEIALLASDLAKLATYVGEKKRIREADVAKLVGAGRVETIWSMLEAATAGGTATPPGLLDRPVARGSRGGAPRGAGCTTRVRCGSRASRSKTPASRRAFPTTHTSCSAC